jgi:hypothetical protein
MATKKTDKADSTETSLRAFATQVSKTKTVRDGHIVLRLTGNGGGNYAVKAAGGKITVEKEIPAGDHAVELIGDARRILAVLNGSKDAVTQFVAGGFRVRGDSKYISDLGVEMQILKRAIR